MGNTEDINLQIQPFIDACNKMVASKFIMVDKRVSDVLKAIADSAPVFELVKTSMINFSFEREWSKATAKAGQLVPPEENKKFIAFVFSLLNAFDNKKLNVSEVLSKYYSRSDSTQGLYSEFCTGIIEKFKNVVVSSLIRPAKRALQEEVGPKVVTANKDVLARLAFLAKDLKDYVQGLKKLKGSELTKGELAEIVNGLIGAIKIEHTEFIKPFVMAIKAGKGRDKEIERRLVEIMDIVNRTLIDA